MTDALLVMGGPLAAFALVFLTSGIAPFVGASAAVFGVALAFAIAWPKSRRRPFAPSPKMALAGPGEPMKKKLATRKTGAKIRIPNIKPARA